MRPASRALELALLVRPVVQGVAARRTLPKLVTIAVLVVVSAILGAAVLLASLYVVYLTLLQQDFSQIRALLATIATAVIAMLSCLMVVRWRLHRLHESSLPPVEKIAGIIDAFVDGYRTPKP